MSGDGGLWRGGRVHGCVDVGSWCLGALVRYAVDTTAQSFVSRSALETLLMVDRPFHWGRLTLSPGAALGQSSIRSSYQDPRNEEEERTVGLHLRGHLGASFRLYGAWAVGLDLAGAYSPFVTERFGEPDDDDPLFVGGPRLGASLGLGLSYGGL